MKIYLNDGKKLYLSPDLNYAKFKVCTNHFKLNNNEGTQASIRAGYAILLSSARSIENMKFSIS